MLHNSYNPPAPIARNPVISVIMPEPDDRVKLVTIGRLYTFPRSYKVTESTVKRLTRKLSGCEVDISGCTYKYRLPEFKVIWQCAACGKKFTDSVNYGEYLWMSADDERCLCADCCADCCELQPVTE